MQQRIITGLVFGGIVLLLLSIGYIGSVVLLTVITLGASYEYTQITKPPKLLQFLSVALALGTFIFLSFGAFDEKTLFYIALFSVIIHILAIQSLYISFDFHKFIPAIVILLFGLPLGVMAKFIALHPESSTILLYTILLVWICDSTAYFVGSKFGKHKLMMKISPGKTWEGFFGAGVGAIVFAVVCHLYNNNYPLVFCIAMSVIVWIFGAYGDLFESSIKRKFGVKDSGNFMPGHGGFYDRFDAFIFVLPFIVLLHFIYFNL
ncbi:MAG: phosphatidate cytidylyltransferase [Saprospiraceae bacterium]